MINLNKKQKVILIIIISIVVAAVCYYAYAKDGGFGIEGGQEMELVENQNSNDNNSGDSSSNDSDIENVGNNSNENIENREVSQKIIVHISGAVQKEGIVELDENSRVADAIEKAGGLKDNAYMKDINLAYKIEDGMKVHIPTKEEHEKLEKEQALNGENKAQEYVQRGTKGGAESSNSKGNAGFVGSEKNDKVNINTATQTMLETLPGIGPSTALKIINYRKEKGKFKTIEEIKEVSGIGESKFNQIKNLISV